MLILAVVMTALAPALYDMMRASSGTDQRSVADGIAVGASEQIRSLPYYEVGYQTTTPNYCAGSNPVTLGYYTPMSDFPKVKTVSQVTYTIETCVYWVQAAAPTGSTVTYTDAYKETVVKVEWGPNNAYSYTDSSALYPGGESAYASGGQQNFTPSNVTATTVATPPATPTANYASVSAASPTDSIDVDWQPVTSTSTVQYIVEWWTGATRPTTPSQSPTINGTSDGASGLTYEITGLTAGVAYNMDVLAVSGSQVSNPSNTVSATTNPASTAGCIVNSINVTPSSPAIDTSGNPVNFSSLAVTVQATSACADLTVEYGTNGADGAPSAPLTTVDLTYVSGSFTGSASQSTWSARTYGFVVYSNQTATTAQANVTPCQVNPATGSC